MSYEDNKRKLEEKIKEWRHSQDKYIVKCAYDSINLQDAYPFDDKAKDRLIRTNYSRDTDKELYGKFASNVFNKLSNEELTHLFQEVCNRHTEINNAEPKYICSVEAMNKNIVGCMSTTENTLKLNEYLINKGKTTEKNPEDKMSLIFNKDTVGFKYMSTIMHETEHTIQMQQISNYLMGVEMNPDDKAMGAIMLMENAVKQYVADNTKIITAIKLLSKYNDAWEEFGANTYATKNMYNIVKNDEKLSKDPNALDILYGEVSYGMRIPAELVGDKRFTSTCVNKRARKMEKNIKRYIGYFDKFIEDCELKDMIMSTVKDYVNYDKKTKGPSDFYMKAVKEGYMMANVSQYCVDQKNKINQDEVAQTF